VLLVANGDDLDVRVVLDLVEDAIISQSQLPWSERVLAQHLAAFGLLVGVRHQMDLNPVDDDPLLEGPLVVEVRFSAGGEDDVERHRSSAGV
jgi:hypothetical protein